MPIFFANSALSWSGTTPRMSYALKMSSREPIPASPSGAGPHKLTNTAAGRHLRAPSVLVEEALTVWAA